jgi:hypothetical protein
MQVAGSTVIRRIEIPNYSNDKLHLFSGGDQAFVANASGEVYSLPACEKVSTLSGNAFASWCGKCVYWGSGVEICEVAPDKLNKNFI